MVGGREMAMRESEYTGEGDEREEENGWNEVQVLILES